MGSSGSGSFSDYSGNKPTSQQQSNGGSGKVDKCALAFATSLEEVSRCDYYNKSKMLPPIGTEVSIVFNGVRLTAVETSTRTEIGYLPTKFNYIKVCIDDGYSYSGVVRTNSLTPMPTVLVDIVPS